jgi:hypothetical protein
MSEQVSLVLLVYSTANLWNMWHDGLKLEQWTQESRPFLDNGSANTVPQQWIRNRKTVESGVFYAIRANAI